MRAEEAPARPAAAARWSGRAPHRRASWMLATLTLVALGGAALAWSAVLAGRWTILSTTAVLTTFGVLMANGFFRVNMAEGGWVRVRVAGAAASIGVTAALAVVSVPGLGQPSVPSFVSLVLVLVGAATVSRMYGRLLLSRLWARGHLRARALLFGYDELARELALEVSLRPAYGVDIVGYIIPYLPGAGPLPSGEVSEALVEPRQPLPAALTATLAAIGADRLIVGPAVDPVGEHLAQRLARWAALQGMAVHVVPRFYGMGMGLDSMSPDQARGYPLVRIQRSAHPRLSIRLKRLLDLSVAGTLLILAAPLMAAAALAVRLSGPGPILFAQERVGQFGRPITVRKFRSMTVSSTSDTEWTADGRVTRIGRLLRRTNIDELPQLFSVFVGDMSLVGPRPERPAFVEHFRQRIPDYDDRHRMPVGVTGLAQVAGLRGDTSIAERVKYDNLYIDQWCLRSDIEILLRTITAVLFQEAESRRVVELESAIERMRGDES
ncbi:MAG: exopolysaccharide biosynthesis polyprenyl glycosylphosphotransferase [Acidimicrobiia bacterium]|nr:exopolysaccharide biosynthesis polyprenyl glycosylphosphotransferase [Acidimicrobiia bacterium]MDH4364857.1 exopolysaccharide biosynthesis polyprenyl glycosylphosphotransferase [Acidimicrobiia bacterium]